MHIREATQSYETWLGLYTTLVEDDLARKHKLMHDNAFSFFRATFYRWCTRFPIVCKAIADAPKLLCAGDLHVENFGTWRDEEGRLVWGINDFDEANVYPYTMDLVRLCASVVIAIESENLPLEAKAACAAVLKGYTSHIGGHDAAPFVLEEDHEHLRAIAVSSARAPQAFWKKLMAAKTAEPPKKARKLMDVHMPEGHEHLRHIRRTAGAGSLGLPRFVALSRERGALIAREAKARVPGVLAWAGLGDYEPNAYRMLIEKSVRAQDPFVWVNKSWLIRRLGPHCEQIELSDIDRKKPLIRVVEAMGAETANVHRNLKKAGTKILRDLAERDAHWLHDHAGRMAEDVTRDWKAWRKVK